MDVRDFQANQKGGHDGHELDKASQAGKPTRPGVTLWRETTASGHQVTRPTNQVPEAPGPGGV